MWEMDVMMKLYVADQVETDYTLLLQFYYFVLSLQTLLIYFNCRVLLHNYSQ